MNKEISELRKEVINLDEQVENSSHIIRTTEDFIREKGEYYTSEESIKALNEMRAILAQKNEEYKTLCNNSSERKRKLWDSCQHEILVKDQLNNNFCAICGRLIIDIPTTSLLQITWPDTYCLQTVVLGKRKHSNWQTNIEGRLQEIIEKGLESDNMLGYVEEELEELQYEEDISIRRLTK